MNTKKLIFSTFILIITGISTYIYYKNHLPVEKKASLKNQQKNIKNTDAWVTVFVHGSFGTLLGLLSLPRVVQDNVANSLYHEITKKMRSDDTFYSLQPIREKGLIRIYPSFDTAICMDKKLAAFPIIKSYEVINQALNPNELNFFYTFGWSGLISQQRRRMEAIRLYNNLAEEIEKISNQGYNPKIRLIAHSHGGNICLNLASIAHILQAKKLSESYKFSLDPNENESISKMIAIIKHLPSKENAMLQTGQKRYDYVPYAKKIAIDELIMLGTPIQVENARFALSPFFKHIYNIYSEKDVIQELDWVSTKQGISSQRFSNEILHEASKNFARKKSHITQAKITYEQPITKPNQTEENFASEAGITYSLKSLFLKFLKSNPLQKDPNHKELWFLSWHNINTKNESFVTPLPTVTFIPFIIKALNLCPYIQDLDLNLTTTNNTVLGLVHKHGCPNYEEKTSMPLEIITDIKKQLSPWNQGPSNDLIELNKSYDYLSGNKTTEKSTLFSQKKTLLNTSN